MRAIFRAGVFTFCDPDNVNFELLRVLHEGAGLRGKPALSCHLAGPRVQTGLMLNSYHRDGLTSCMWDWTMGSVRLYVCVNAHLK